MICKNQINRIRSKHNYTPKVPVFSVQESIVRYWAVFPNYVTGRNTLSHFIAWRCSSSFMTQPSWNDYATARPVYGWENSFSCRIGEANQENHLSHTKKFVSSDILENFQRCPGWTFHQN